MLTSHNLSLLFTCRYFQAQWDEDRTSSRASIACDLPLEAINCPRSASDETSSIPDLPHVCFFSQRVRIRGEKDTCNSSFRAVEELELKKQAPLDLLPYQPPADTLSLDTEDLLHKLSDGGLHNMLLGFFAQQ